MRLPRWSRPATAVAPLLAACALLAPRVVAGGPPAGFFVEPVLRAPNAFVVHPTQIAFLPDGRMLVAGKSGLVWMAKDGLASPAPVWDGVAEVSAEVDRGLTGIAVDPDFAHNRFVYFLYTVDPDSSETNPPQMLTFCRLTRYQMSAIDTNRVDESSRTVLIGRTWTDGAVNVRPSHGAGSLRWGRDGSLLVSIGDGARWHVVDAGGQDPQAFGPGRTDPAEDIGAYRAQDLNSLCGKILRIDPRTGLGYASNPYADGDLGSARSRVYQYGLRSPYRFVVRPGTGNPDPAAGDPGVLFIGDTGWNTWEEIDVADQPGLNFGWPCREGAFVNVAYRDSAQPAHHGCGTLGSPLNPGALRGPTVAWAHRSADTAAATPPGWQGTAGVGGEFHAGFGYPSAYRGRFFFADFGADWIASAVMGTANTLTAAQPFTSAADSPVDLEVDPWTGDLYAIAIFGGPNGWGEIRRIRWAGTPGNQGPVAVIGAAPAFFVTGDAIALAGSGSDAEDAAAALVHQWKIDRVADGAIGFDAAVSLGAATQLTAAGASPYEAHLVVYDTDGRSDTACVVVRPEVDLAPSAVVVDGELGGPAPVEVSFRLHNRGRMPSESMHWMLIADGERLAEGDTLVPSLDSVLVTRGFQHLLASGDHVLRLVADTTGAITETDEANNAWSATFTTTGAAGAPAGPPALLGVSQAYPNPSRRATTFKVWAAHAARLDWRVLDVHGREVWRQSRAVAAGLTALSWDGRDLGGERVRPGLYFARLAMGGRPLVRRFVVAN